MTDNKELNEKIAKLERDNAELSGMMLATGVILTQLLQSNCRRELNPQGAATRVMEAAREGIEGYSTATKADPRLTKRALEAVQQYEDQIRSVLAV